MSRGDAGHRDENGLPQSSFETLVRKAFEGSLAEMEFETLQQELLESPENRRFYLDYASVHTLLIQEFDEANPLALREEPSHFLSRSLWVLAGLTACICLWFANGVWQARPVQNPIAIVVPAAPQAVPVENVAEPVPVPVAELVGVVTPEGNSPAKLQKVARSFFPGELLEIGPEIVDLHFRSGANVILQGPGTLRIVSPLRCELLAGLATCHVPKEAMGFTIQVQGADIVDLGTTFGVSLTQEGQSAISVFDGRVQTYSIDSDGSSYRGPELLAGRSVRLNHESRSWENIPFDEDRYARLLGYQRGVLDYSSEVQFLATQPRSLDIGGLESQDIVYLIPERTGFDWPANIFIDSAAQRSAEDDSPALLEQIDADGAVLIQTELASEDLTAKALPASMKNLTSFMLHYDPPGQPVVPAYGSEQTSPYDRQGQVTFAGKIVGLIWRQATLDRSDPVGGLPDTLYHSALSRRRVLSMGSTIEVSPDRRTLSFNFLSRKELESTLIGIDELRILVDLNESDTNADGEEIAPPAVRQQ